MLSVCVCLSYPPSLLRFMGDPHLGLITEVKASVA